MANMSRSSQIARLEQLIVSQAATINALRDADTARIGRLRRLEDRVDYLEQLVDRHLHRPEPAASLPDGPDALDTALIERAMDAQRADVALELEDVIADLHELANALENVLTKLKVN